MENIQYPAPKQEYKVLVRCFTFNHSKYIEDALNGFAMQQTDFPFVCLVVDDASTDGEQEVVKKWMERECDFVRAETIDIPTSIVIIVPHKTNPLCTFAFYLLKQNLYKVKEQKMAHVAPWREKCEYEALCEGDDYWIDPLKLQKQVGVMDTDNQIGLCYTRAKKFNQSLDTFDSELCGLEYKGFSQMLYENPVVTLTTMYRVELYDKYIRDVNPYTKSWKMGDYPFWLWIAAHHKVSYLDDVTSVYRVLENSASHSEDRETNIRFLLSNVDIQLYFSQIYFPEICEFLSNKSIYYKSLLLACRKEYADAIKMFSKVRNKSVLDSIRFAKYILW